ncbi:hypothetical protein [Nocardia gamkensis]|uniref:Uncharacterized protein n=1 Tax=Nocardia gamkensis TaxID=352869 RepID=A0A7X6R7E2_9NOCA|nr:hypothetical protein [Nocardia gamkensis]NKY31357.1 hypothetical protein [Nocardia gamkensis]NQE71890.1 hypothetical protein [Nocardia gamkensis]
MAGNEMVPVLMAFGVVSWLAICFFASTAILEYRVSRAEKLYLEPAASRSLPSDADIERLCDLTEPRRDPWVRAEPVPA